MVPDEAKAAEITEKTLQSWLKIYLEDANDPMTYTRILMSSMADQFFYGVVDRMENNSELQDMYLYEMDSRTEMFYDNEFHGNSPNFRPDFVKTDHFDDISYMYGFPFLPEFYLLWEGASFTEQEKEFAKRVMKIWSNFAMTGTPGWNKYDKSKKLCNVLNKEGAIINFVLCIDFIFRRHAAIRQRSDAHCSSQSLENFCLRSSMI